MSYLDDIIQKSTQKVAQYDKDKYRKELSDTASQYGVKYTDFHTQDTFGAERPKSKLPYYIGAGVLLIATGVFIYIKKKNKKKK